MPAASHCSTRSAARGARCSASARVDLERVGERGLGLAAGTHHLVDAVPVVREQHARPVDDDRRAAVVDLERVVGGTGEEAGEVDEEVGIGARVAVDHLVVVADAEHVERGRGDQPDEQQVGGAQVLELVDQQVPALALHRARAARGRGSSASTAPAICPSKSIAPSRSSAVAVEVVHRGEPVDVAPLALHVRGGAQPELHLLQRLEVGAERVGVGAEPELEVGLDALADGPLVEHLDAGPGPPHDLEAERVERADLVARAAREIGEAVLHLGAGRAGCTRARTRSRGRSRARPRDGGSAR